MNRAEQIWSNWEEKQRRLESLHGLDESSAAAIRRDRYDYLRHGLYRLSVNPSPDERMFGHVIRMAASRIRKQLYPNPVVRALVRLKEQLYDRPIHIKQFLKEREKSVEQLKEQFRKKGFPPSEIKLEDLINTEAEKVKQELGSQLGAGKRLYLDITFQSGISGQIRLEEFVVTFVDRDNDEKRSYLLSAESDITLKEAASLLQGRAMRKSFQNTDGVTAYQWLQADLSARDGQENQKIVAFNTDYPYDLKNVLAEFSHSAGLTGLVRDDVIRVLEEGKQLSFVAKDGETYYLHANPMEQSLSLSDRNGKPLQMDVFLEQVKTHQEKIAEQQRTLVRTIGKATDKDQSLHI